MSLRNRSKRVKLVTNWGPKGPFSKMPFHSKPKNITSLRRGPEGPFSKMSFHLKLKNITSLREDFKYYFADFVRKGGGGGGGPPPKP